VTRDVLAAVGRLAGSVELDLTPRETPWTTPLDEDEEHATYDPAQVAVYFAAATRAAFVLAALRAPYRGRSTPVNAWWGSFDLAVSLFSGRRADAPADDFITRNSMDAEDVAIGWWPGDPRYARAAFYAYVHPPADAFASVQLVPAARWDETLRIHVLDWDDVRASPNPHETALEFGRSAVLHGCRTCDWDPALAGSLEGDPPPVR
jgi:hypothetical protein